MYLVQPVFIITAFLKFLNSFDLLHLSKIMPCFLINIKADTDGSEISA